MFEWFVRWRKRCKLAPALRYASVAEYERGTIDGKQRDRLITGSYDKDVLNRTLDQLETREDLYGEIDWEAIFTWVQENLIPILRIVIPIVIMLLEPNAD